MTCLHKLAVALAAAVSALVFYAGTPTNVQALSEPEPVVYHVVVAMEGP